MIGKLIRHQLNILREEDLTNWDNQGVNISITGRGDELPIDILEIIPEKIKDDFHELIENSVEIGIVDLYGKNTSLPDLFLEKCISILNKHKIELDVPKLFHKRKVDKNSWGNIWSDRDYNILLEPILKDINSK